MVWGKHNLGTVVDMASGLLFVVLAVFVARVRPRRPVNLWFAAFAGLFGAGLFLDILFIFEVDLPAREPTIAAGAVLLLMAAIAAFAMGVLFVQGIGAGSSAALVAATSMAVGFSVAANLIFLFGLEEFAGQGFFQRGAVGAERLLAHSVVTLQGAMWGVLVVLAIAYRRMGGKDPAESRRIALMSAAITLYPAFCAGAGITRGTSVVSGLPSAVLYGALATTAAVLVAGLWLWNTRIAGLERPARNLALLALATPLVGVVVSWSGLHGGYGWARTLGVVILGYAVVRHSLFDIAFTANWTLRRGTLAGFVVVVFFVASEGAQELFATQFDSALVGILAAALLMFWIAPLQRVAERLADRAVPEGRADSTLGPKERREVFRHAVEMALADGVVSPSEERALARIASVFDFSPSEALELRQTVEDDHAPAALHEGRARPSGAE